MKRGKHRKNATQKMRNWNGLRRRSGVPRRQISLTCVQIIRSDMHYKKKTATFEEELLIPRKVNATSSAGKYRTLGDEVKRSLLRRLWNSMMS